MRKCLLENNFYNLFEDSSGFWVLERSSVQTDDLSLMEDAHRVLWAAMRKDIQDKVLLIDLRQARGRNDEAFEKSLVNFRVRVTSQPKHVLILVQTQLGVMHVDRHARNDGVKLEIFVDEALAFAKANELA